MAARIIKESPKLQVLKEILEELGYDEECESNEITILITANDDRTCSQIKHVNTTSKFEESRIFFSKNILNINSFCQKTV